MMVEHEKAHEEKFRRRARRLFVFVGGFVCISSIAVAVLSWIILGMLAENAREHADVVGQMTGLAQSVLAYRTWIPLLALVTLVDGVALIALRPRVAIGWIMSAAATLWLLLVVAAVLYTFISFMTPLYEYKPLT